MPLPLLTRSHPALNRFRRTEDTLQFGRALAVKLDFIPNGDQFKQFFDIMVAHANTTMGRIMPYRRRIVCAVDTITFNAYP